MLKYTITKSDANNGTKDKWYGRIVYDETIDMDGLAEHMRQHNIPYTKGQLKGVMADLVRCIYELTTAGKKVKLPDLGIFRIKAVVRVRRLKMTAPSRSVFSETISASVLLAR